MFRTHDVRATRRVLDMVATDRISAFDVVMNDVVPGRGGMFSLEGPEGLRFLTRSRLYTDEERKELAQAVD